MYIVVTTVASVYLRCDPTDYQEGLGNYSTGLYRIVRGPAQITRGLNHIRIRLLKMQEGLGNYLIGPACIVRGPAHITRGID